MHLVTSWRSRFDNRARLGPGNENRMSDDPILWYLININFSFRSSSGSVSVENDLWSQWGNLYFGVEDGKKLMECSMLGVAPVHLETATCLTSM